MSEKFAFDPSNERGYFAIPGLQHKYRETVLLFVAQDCLHICDWCFRKRLFEGQALADDQVVDPDEALSYLRSHEEVHSVILSGGDALVAEPGLLSELCDGIAELDHIHSVRIGTRALVHDPHAFAHLIPRRYAKKLYVMLHIVRPEEVSPQLAEALESLHHCGVLAQTPLLAGINAEPDQLAELWYRMTAANIQPYYVFQCRPARGNERFALTLGEGHDVFSGAQSQSTGVAKTARYVMSNRSGKWEVIGIDHDEVVLRCHQGVLPEMVGATRRASAHAVWWDLPKDDPLIDAIPLWRPASSDE